MVSQVLDILLTFSVLSFWFVFPVGIYFAVEALEKTPKSFVSLEHL